MSLCQPLQPPTSPGLGQEGHEDRPPRSQAEGGELDRCPDPGPWQFRPVPAALCPGCPVHCHLEVRELSPCPLSPDVQTAARSVPPAPDSGCQGPHGARLQCPPCRPGHLWEPLSPFPVAYALCLSLNGFSILKPCPSWRPPYLPTLHPYPSLGFTQSRCSAPCLVFTLWPPGGARTPCWSTEAPVCWGSGHVARNLTRPGSLVVL